jgi:hypothetical protein
MADEKQAQRDEAEKKDERHDDLELPKETAEQVKGGSWDLKQNKST